MADMGEFPYPLDAMPMFVLQVASVDGGHVKDLPSLPLSLCLLGGFPLSLALSVFHALSIFFYMLTQESSLPLCCSSRDENVSSKVASSVGMTCMT